MLDDPLTTANPRPAAAPDTGRPRLLRPGHNCWRIERAGRLAFLVDGQDYFGAVRAALVKARKSFFILGWDIDSRMRLTPHGAQDSYPEPLGEFLNAVVSRRHELRGYVLTWDYAMLYALEREWLPVYQFDWKTHRRLSFRLDDCHPVGASHHQKLIVIDDEVAFVSGFDLAGSRWDTSEHAHADPLRVNASGTAYAPFHDVGAIVSGPCATALGELCRERWRRSTGHVARNPRKPSADRGDPWPDHVEPVLTDVDVGIARTEPAYADHGAVDELRHLHLDAISAARRFIFAENQYFTSRIVADAFGRRLAETEGPEIAVLMPAVQSGWLETTTMGVLRARIHRQLRGTDANSRYQLYCPTLHGPDDDEQCINVHSKVLIVDDELLTLGSANLSSRSLCLDTECNIAIEAGGDPKVRSAISGLRERLLGEHLGVTPQRVAEATKAQGSLHRAIASLEPAGPRSLKITEPALDSATDAIVPDHDVLDPERPLDPDVLIEELLPVPEHQDNVRTRLTVLVGLIAVLAALAFAWRYTPLGDYLNVNDLAAYAETFRDMPLAPVLVPLIFVIGGLVMVPVMLLIAVTALVFGPFPGILYAFAGALASASVTYEIGKRLGRHAVRKVAGQRLNDLSRQLGKRGLLAVLLIRLLPVAPYTVINIVAGASHIGWRDYLLGTALGLAPGIVMIMLFVDRAVAAIRSPGPGTLAVLAVIVVGIIGVGYAFRRMFGRQRARDDARAAAAPLNAG